MFQLKVEMEYQFVIYEDRSLNPLLIEGAFFLSPRVNFPIPNYKGDTFLFPPVKGVYLSISPLSHYPTLPICFMYLLEEIKSLTTLSL